MGNKYHPFQIFLPSHKKNNFHEQTKNCSFLFLQNKHFRGEGTTVGWVDWLSPRSTFSTIIQGGLKCPTHNGTRQHFCWQRTPVSFLAFHKHQNKQIEGNRQKNLIDFCQNPLQIVLVQKNNHCNSTFRTLMLSYSCSGMVVAMLAFVICQFVRNRGQLNSTQVLILHSDIKQPRTACIPVCLQTCQFTFNSIDINFDSGSYVKKCRLSGNISCVFVWKLPFDMLDQHPGGY